MKSAITFAILCASTLAVAEEHGVYFAYKDWEIVCDNTLTCRMAGYDRSDNASGSVLFTRSAGPGTPLDGKMMLADDDNGSPPVLTLWIDGQSLGELNKGQDDVYPLTPPQTRALLAALKGVGKITFKGGKPPFVLSGAGASAVMLKMDAVQGRIGTPGALIRTGEKPENSARPALPAPVIHAAKVSDALPRPLTAPELATLKPRLLQTLDKEMCDVWNPERMEGEEPALTLTPLDAEHALISTLCWSAAYNMGNVYWIIDRALKKAPEQIGLEANHYQKGVLSNWHKGRGIGDCWRKESWVWDGREFRQSEITGSVGCHGIPAWRFPMFVTEVKPAE
ncbi:MAG: DUF1176 domain-containing protein [Zoogloeaceae bacterium]|jgi:hypothetical protein|nr:DUF1176 domain-containing protein [Zoogloeaceae bacterium]